MRTLAFAAALVALPSAARATITDCSTAWDGTPCDTACTIGGTCEAGECVGGSALPDGTACATGNRCTTGDACQSGVCVAGSIWRCPARTCYSSFCSTAVGCVYTWTCGDQPAPPAFAVADLSELPDAGGPALAGSDDPAAPSAWHVHGSGCSLAHNGDGAVSLIAIALMLQVAVRGRFRVFAVRQAMRVRDHLCQVGRQCAEVDARPLGREMDRAVDERARHLPPQRRA